MAKNNIIFTVQDVAEMLGLKKAAASARGWCGPNPWREGATEDGFILWPEGNATDANSARGNYPCPIVAEMAGIPKKQYEPYVIYMESHSSSFPSGQQEKPVTSKPRTEPRVMPQAAPEKAPPTTKAYNIKTLQERGIRPKTLAIFKIALRNGAYHYPTFLPNGQRGKERIKYLDPKKQFPDALKPPKYIWNKFDEYKMPSAYNLNNLVGEDVVWMVNGEPSVWVTYQCGMPAIAPLGEGKNKGYTNIFGDLKKLGIERVYIVLDNDKAGRNGALRARNAAKEFEIECIIKRLPDLGPGFDVSDFYEYLKFNDEDFVSGMESLPVVANQEIENWIDEDVDESTKKNKKADEEGESRAAQLVKTIKDESILLTGNDGSFYARAERKDRIETYEIGDGNFSLYLRHRWMMENNGGVLDATTITDAMESLKSYATFDDDGNIKPKEEIFVRTGYDHANNLYIDLNDDQYNTVVIKPDGTWTITQKAPITFRRGDGMEALPIPQTGGDINLLRDFLNADDQAQWIKMVSWMIYALRGPLAPYPVLSVHGERGSAKSTTCRVIRRCIDPNFVAMNNLRSLDERNLAISAKNSYVAGFDNATGMSQAVNDALCSLATEGGLRIRKLRTDSQEILLKARRPIIVNGIDDSIGGEDFRNRCVPVYLQPISNKSRREEEDIYFEVDKVLPQILGGLIDIVAYAHSKMQTTVLKSGPRMKDFARFIVAAEDVCPWKKGTFLPLMMNSSKEADVVALESNLIGMVIKDIMKNRDILENTPEGLLKTLNQLAPHTYKQARTWPATPSHLMNNLNRVAANLRQVGIYINGLNPHDRASGSGMITIRKQGYHGASSH